MYFCLSGKNVTEAYLDEMVNAAPGPINFTMFLTMFGEKLNGTDPEDVIKNAFACFDDDSKGLPTFFYFCINRHYCNSAFYCLITNWTFSCTSVNPYFAVFCFDWVFFISQNINNLLQADLVTSTTSLLRGYDVFQKVFGNLFV